MFSHAQPRNWLGSVFFFLLRRDFLVKNWKCVWYTHIVLRCLFPEWICHHGRRVGAVSGCWWVTPCVMLRDLASLWQDMMSLDQRSKESWLFDSSFPHWKDTPAALQTYFSYLNLEVRLWKRWHRENNTKCYMTLWCIYCLLCWTRVQILSSIAAIVLHISPNPTEVKVV